MVGGRNKGTKETDLRDLILNADCGKPPEYPVKTFKSIVGVASDKIWVCEALTKYEKPLKSPFCTMCSQQCLTYLFFLAAKLTIPLTTGGKTLASRCHRRSIILLAQLPLTAEKDSGLLVDPWRKDLHPLDLG